MQKFKSFDVCEYSRSTKAELHNIINRNFVPLPLSLKRKKFVSDNS